MERYYDEDGDLVVLYSPGFGAGWSTWERPEIAFDKRIVEYFIKNHPSCDDMKDFLDSIGYEDMYMGGYSRLKTRSIPRNTLFRIREYDGSEFIETFDESDWIKA